jgi:hypothetical protein
MRKYPTRNGTVNQSEEEPSSIAVLSPDEDAIAKLAYDLWIERGCPEGSPEEDWFRASGLLYTGRAVSASST